MLTNNDWQILRELRVETKMKCLEVIIKDYVKEALCEWQEEQRQRNEQEKPLLNIEDLAKRFKITKATVHNWINRGIITGKKLGKNRYFTDDEVRKALTKYGFTKQWDNEDED